MTPKPPADDPALTSSRREAGFAVAVWAAALVYTLGYCYVYGYRRPPEELTLVWGIPDWVLWGVFAPWTVCTVVSIAFAYGYMTDVPLEDETQLVGDDLATHGATDAATDAATGGATDGR